MKQADFERRVISLWTTTRVPLTRANLMAHTQASRAEIEAWAADMVRANLLELDSDDTGELEWKVRGAVRPARGADTIGHAERLARLSAEVGSALGGASSATTRALGAATDGNRKSLVASGLLPLFLGPLGWLYAAPLIEAVPAIVVWIVVCKIVPTMLLAYLIGPLNLAAAAAGVLYAWSYNRSGRRVPLLLKDPTPRLPR